MSDEEYKKQLGFKNLLDDESKQFYDDQNKAVVETNKSTEEKGRGLQSLPSSVDWRSQNAVSSIKN